MNQEKVNRGRRKKRTISDFIREDVSWWRKVKATEGKVKIGWGESLTWAKVNWDWKSIRFGCW